ncbi:Hypp8341 [Branchiostoma lanceolatum]|uniref:Hypp6978 protein n=2 Tax=Branchiostoma lanceolatum TaxID=7740 RepID=A0A8J9YW66_BRALA|nr:Hypp6978 [Branchiostoma lanceolatum]CAH1248647.1 Hypp8341 [Branchiostoma lanceolatum]
MGKKTLHNAGCPYKVEEKRSTARQCNCPTRLAYKTVDSYIGKLRAIFSSEGRIGEWDPIAAQGNPATSPLMKAYLKVITQEQLEASVPPQQAVPIFLSKLARLATHIEGRLRKENSPVAAFILARDQAFFKTLFFSGDRGGDLLNVRTDDVKRLPSGGLLFNQVWGKTLRGGRTNMFALEKVKDETVCPVRGLDLYIDTARQLQVPLDGMFLFPPTTKEGEIANKQAATSTMEAALRKYLKALNDDDGETIHSFRTGCAITLAMTGVPKQQAMEHIGWFSEQTPTYYTKLSRVMGVGGVSAALASEEAEKAVRDFETANDVRHVEKAFITQ